MKGLEAYTYAPGTNRIQEITGYNPTTFTLDAAGNVTDMGDKTFVYNQRHRLIRVEQGAEVLGEYTYNGLGQRVIKEVNGQKTIFLYNHNNRLIAVADESGNITTEYLYRGKILMAKTDEATGSLYFYLNDRLGTPLMMTDESNTLVWEAMYRPFGEAMVNPNSTVANNLRFPGQYYDQETGLHYNYHRYYDPRSGRYLRPDPIGQAGGINVFLYAENNPVNAIDPHGLFVGSLSLKLIGRAIGASAEGAYIAGKVADSAIGVGISANVLPSPLTDLMGPTAPVLQLVGGAQTYGLGVLIAGASSSVALPVVFAGLAGVQIGLGFNSLYEYISGQPLGADIYDWFHPANQCED